MIRHTVTRETTSLESGARAFTSGARLIRALSFNVLSPPSGQLVQNFGRLNAEHWREERASAIRRHSDLDRSTSGP
ncbi:MAG TPA: hypothetical protein VFA34_13530 [Actinomycetota bacterium]|nr:hypothetical protein [Actinomycetota bacterium]